MIEALDAILRGAGGILAYGILLIIFYGIWRGTRRQVGRVSGRAGGWLRSLFFYVPVSLIFFGLSAWAWKPLPIDISNTARIWFLIIGSVLFFPGLGFVLWGRLELGKDYFVSTGMGAQLFQGQRLVTTGPFAIVRHPMYLGLIVTAMGSLLLYHTWTTLAFAIFAPFTLLRARREELALAAEFGEEWREYTRQVPAFFPHLKGHP